MQNYVKLLLCYRCKQRAPGSRGKDEFLMVRIKTFPKDSYIWAEPQEGRAGSVKEADLTFQAEGVSFHVCWMISTEPGGNGLSAVQEVCL